MEGSKGTNGSVFTRVSAASQKKAITNIRQMKSVTDYKNTHKTAGISRSPKAEYKWKDVRKRMHQCLRERL